MTITVFSRQLIADIHTNKWQDKVLDLSGQKLSEAEVINLCQALENNTYIKSLSLRGCNIGAASAQALAGNRTLNTLNVSVNNIGTIGARALAGNRTLNTLDVSHNKLGDASAEAFARNCTLTTLIMTGNKIRNAGARALAGNCTLKSLDLDYNQIGDSGARALARHTTLLKLCLRGNVSSNDTGSPVQYTSAVHSELKLMLANNNRIANDAGNKVAILTTAASYRADPSSELKGSIIDLLTVINEYADIARPTVVISREIGTARFNKLLNDPNNEVQPPKTRYTQRRLWLLLLIALALPIILAVTKFWVALAVVGCLYLTGILIGGMLYCYGRKKHNRTSLVSVADSNAADLSNPATPLLAPTLTVASSPTNRSTNSSSRSEAVSLTISAPTFPYEVRPRF
jgi:hypothetical protein